MFTKELLLDKPEVVKEQLNKIRAIAEQYSLGLKVEVRFQEHYTRYQVWIESLINGSSFNVAAAIWYKSFSDMQKQ